LQAVRERKASGRSILKAFMGISGRAFGVL